MGQQQSQDGGMHDSSYAPVTPRPPPAPGAVPSPAGAGHARAGSAGAPAASPSLAQAQQQQQQSQARSRQPSPAIDDRHSSPPHQPQSSHQHQRPSASSSSSRQPSPPPPPRTDSGNDFAMSIADGAAAASAAASQQPPLHPQPPHSQQSSHTDPAHGAGGANAPSSEMHNALGSPAAAATAAEPLMSPTPGPPKIETVPTAFKWVHGGNEVYVTGSFNNWQGKILMYPNEDQEFTLLIDIPPGTHHYKYIVDQEWRLDEDAPTVQIAQVWNNVVEVKRPVFEYTPAGYADSDDDEDDRKQKTAYGQRAPQSNDYVAEPPRLPPHLTDVLLNQSSILDPQMLPVPQHVVLNHLYVMSAGSGPAGQATDAAVLVTGITQRFKPNPHTKITHKFVTTVYYAPSVGTGGTGPFVPAGMFSSPMDVDGRTLSPSPPPATAHAQQQLAQASAQQQKEQQTQLQHEVQMADEEHAPQG